jgi:hypothetical protein
MPAATPAPGRGAAPARNALISRGCADFDDHGGVDLADFGERPVAFTGSSPVQGLDFGRPNLMISQVADARLR